MTDYLNRSHPSIVLGSQLSFPEEIALITVRSGGEKARGFWSDYRESMTVGLLCEWIFWGRLTPSGPGKFTNTQGVVSDPVIAQFDDLLGPEIDAVQWIRKNAQQVESRIMSILEAQQLLAEGTKKGLFGKKAFLEPTEQGAALAANRRAVYRAILQQEAAAPAAESLFLTLMQAITRGVNAFKEGSEPLTSGTFNDSAPSWMEVTNGPAVVNLLETILRDRQSTAISGG